MANILNMLFSRITPESFIDKTALAIANRLDQIRKRGGMDGDEDDVTTHEPIQSLDDIWRDLRSEMSRNGQGVASWKAYMADARVSAQIDAIGDHATAADNEGRVFRLQPDEEHMTPRDLNAFLDVEKRMTWLRLERAAPQIVKRALLEGDAFREVVASPKKNAVVGFRELPGAREGYIMRKLEDKETGNHVGWALYSVRDGTPQRVFAPWQVVQFSWNQFLNYGIPLFVSARLDIERIIQMEESMFVAREERAYVKFAHIYEEFTEAQLRRVRRLHELRRRARGKGSLGDIFTNKDVKMFDPSNAGLSNINDVQYIEDKILTAGRVPKGELGGYGEDINRAVLEKQEESLIRFLSKLNAMLSDGFREVAETQLLMNSVLPEDVPFSFLWTEKKVDNFKETAEALAILVEKIRLSPQSAQEELGYDPEQEWARNVEWLEREAELEQKLSDNQDRVTKEIDALNKKAGTETESVDSIPNLNGTNGTRNHKDMPRRLIAPLKSSASRSSKAAWRF